MERARGPTITPDARERRRSGMRLISHMRSPCCVYHTVLRARAQDRTARARSEWNGKGRYFSRSRFTSVEQRSNSLEDFDVG